MGLHETKKFLHSKGNQQQNKKTTDRVGEHSLIRLIRGQYPKFIKYLKTQHQKNK